jgi:hypothetical protein
MRSFAALLCLLTVAACAASARDERPLSHARDLAKYDKGGVFDFPLFPSSDADRKKYDWDNARLREFVWSHWTQRRCAYVRVIHHGIEGQRFVADHYFERDSRRHWSMSWASIEAMRIYTIEQIQPRTDHPASRWRFEWMGYAGRFGVKAGACLTRFRAMGRSICSS